MQLLPQVQRIDVALIEYQPVCRQAIEGGSNGRVGTIGSYQPRINPFDNHDYPVAMRHFRYCPHDQHTPLPSEGMPPSFRAHRVYW